jgi:hypothetical protein
MLTRHGHPLNAVVVLSWGGRTYPDGGTVYLTNDPVRDPFVAFDAYDGRSAIENSIFKEGKQPWHLEQFPQRTAAAVSQVAHSIPVQRVGRGPQGHALALSPPLSHVS